MVEEIRVPLRRAFSNTEEVSVRVDQKNDGMLDITVHDNDGNEIADTSLPILTRARRVVYQEERDFSPGERFGRNIYGWSKVHWQHKSGGNFRVRVTNQYGNGLLDETFGQGSEQTHKYLEDHYAQNYAEFEYLGDNTGRLYIHLEDKRDF